MFTRLFNRDEGEVYLVDDGVPGDYGHEFGGEARHDGAVPPECPHPVHLFYNLDLSDPQLGIQLANAKITYLPLYYALGNLGGPFRYRVVSDTRIEMLCQPYPKQFRAGILKNYPEPFDPSPVELTPLDYDPKNPEDVWNLGGVLGIERLTARQRTTLRKKLKRWHLEQIGFPLLEEHEQDMTIEEIVERCTPFTQGMPEETCPNPKCNQHKAGTPLPPLLLLDPDEGDDFYESIAGGDSGQLIWQLCRTCASVVVTNPCT
jgi:hypothetical protein